MNLGDSVLLHRMPRNPRGDFGLGVEASTEWEGDMTPDQQGCGDRGLGQARLHMQRDP